MQTNLDKICAEYGMDLLNFPAELYGAINGLIKESSNISALKKQYTISINKDDTEEEKREKKKKEKFGNYILSILKYKYRMENNFQKFKNKENPLSFDSKTFETEITKALGILVEDGPFAYCIWLKSQDKEPHQAMIIQTARILMELNLIDNISSDDNLKEKLEKAFLEQISTDLTKTLFVKTILEKMLIYARYKAKAMQHE